VVIGSLLTIGVAVATRPATPSGAATTCANYAVLLARSDGSVSIDAPNSNSCAAELAYGSVAGLHLNQPVIGIAADPAGKGYWELASDGGVFAFGQAGFFGSTGSMHLNAPVVGMASTPSGDGYWLVASDGGVFTYGDAQFQGSTGSMHLNAPVVGMAADQATGGYWLVASDGGVFAFDAPFLGSMGGKHLNAPMRFMTGTPDFGGYRLVASDGGVFNYGDAQFYGSAAGPGTSGWSSLATTTDNLGYWLFASSGAFNSYGDADPSLGHAGGDNSNAAVVGAATVLLFPSGYTLPSAASGYFADVSCGTATTCTAVGATQGGASALVESSTDSGAHFTTVPVPSGAPALSSVDCLNASFCVAVGGTQALVTSNGGTTWTLVSTPAALLTSVSCGTTSDCAAVGGGAGPTASIYSTDGGLSWSDSTVAPADSLGVACNPTACVAAGAAPSLSTDGGNTWSTKTVGGGTDGYLSASCTVGGSTCLAIGTSNGAPGPGDLGLSADWGSTWTNESASLPSSTGTAQSVSCGSATDCVVLGPPATADGAIVGASTADSGTSWTAVTGPSGLDFALNPPIPGLTCSGSSTCIVVAANGSGPVAYTTTNAGQAWTADSVQQS
jgi:hypothetical protein